MCVLWHEHYDWVSAFRLLSSKRRRRSQTRRIGSPAWRDEWVSPLAHTLRSVRVCVCVSEWRAHILCARAYVSFGHTHTHTHIKLVFVEHTERWPHHIIHSHTSFTSAVCVSERGVRSPRVSASEWVRKSECFHFDGFSIVFFGDAWKRPFCQSRTH